MDKLLRHRSFVWYATGSIVLAFALEILVNYEFLSSSIGSDRPFWLNVINVHGGIVGLVLLGGAASHAWHAKRRKWAIFMLFVWPVAFLYAFLFNTAWVDE